MTKEDKAPFIPSVATSAASTAAIGAVTGSATTMGSGGLGVISGIAVRSLKIQIDALESLGLSKTLSQPSVFTLNNQEATITQGTQIAYQTTADGTTTTAFKEAALSLTVTPSIIGDGNVLLDILVNNAGITRDVMFHKMSQDEWRDVINVNLNGLFNMTHPVWDGMRTREFGRIVNISSINGQKGQLGQANYSAAKAGELGFTKSLALEGAIKGITVNAICPGYISTDMVKAMSEKAIQATENQIPVGRLGDPNDIARCVEFLVADESTFITGSTITANGGDYLIYLERMATTENFFKLVLAAYVQFTGN